MTSCDLSDQTKNWATVKKVAVRPTSAHLRNVHVNSTALLDMFTSRSQELIYQEFFTQGDLERSQGQKPMAMMDREKACIPELQIDFLDKVALPVFR